MNSDRRSIPLFATLVVVAAVATMIALGVWQLRRAGEKEQLLATYSAARALPVLDLDPLTDGPVPADLAFRRVMVNCSPNPSEPRLTGGRGANGQGGYVYLLSCRPGADGWAGRIEIVAGWSPLPRQDLRLALSEPVAGHVGAVAAEGPIRLYAARAAPPLAPAAPPDVAQVPNNHLAYAFQWFFFACVAALIYFLALRRRLSPRPARPMGAPRP